MDHIEIIVVAACVLLIGGLFGSSAYSTHVKGEIVKAAIEAKVDSATMCIVSQR